MKIRSIKNFDLSHKRILLRADLDVPLLHSKGGTAQPSRAGIFNISVEDDFRLVRMQPTFDLLLSKQAKIVVVGHLGRPGGRIVEEERVAPVVEWFSKRYKSVKYVKTIVGMDARQSVLALGDGEILFLENLRFDSGEEANRESFAKELSTYGQIFVNECFSASHRADASFVGIPQFLPSYAGLNLETEVENLSQVISHSRRPLVVIIGGAKLETKIPVIDKFLSIADKVLVTGKVGVEIEKLPHYHVPKLIHSIGEPDIFPEELDRFSSLISIAGTIVWNGPAGDVSQGYVEGTKRLGEMIVSSNAKTIVGGGDTCAVLNKFGLRGKFSFVSTGGGAMLDFLAGEELPGLKPLIIA